MSKTFESEAMHDMVGREARVRAWLAGSTYIGDTSQEHRLDDPRTKVVLGVDDLVRMLSDLAR